MIEVRVGRGSGRTGAALIALLRERGLRVNDPGEKVDGIVSYGVPVRARGGVPVLNGRAGTRNKYEELQVLQKAGVSVPMHATVRGGIPSKLYLARQFHHSKGKDIRVAGQGDYYVQFIQKAHEYRVYAYRRKAFAVYEKLRLLRGKKQVKGTWRDASLVWNYRNGYAFKFHKTASDALKALGAAAVEALGLDFGAVDIIEDRDGKLFVLEVNTAPGIQGPRQSMVFLANRIERWAKGGFKRRKGDNEQNEG